MLLPHVQAVIVVLMKHCVCQKAFLNHIFTSNDVIPWCHNMDMIILLQIILLPLLIQLHYKENTITSSMLFSTVSILYNKK